jgi:hypothetical protein
MVMITLRPKRGRASSQRIRSRVEGTRLTDGTHHETGGTKLLSSSGPVPNQVSTNRVLWRIACAYFVLLVTIRSLFEQLRRTGRLILVTHQYRAIIRFFRSTSIEIPLLWPSNTTTLQQLRGASDSHGHVTSSTLNSPIDLISSSAFDAKATTF